MSQLRLDANNGWPVILYAGHVKGPARAAKRMHLAVCRYHTNTLISFNRRPLSPAGISKLLLQPANHELHLLQSLFAKKPKNPV